jgi:hypothetical protein
MINKINYLKKYEVKINMIKQHNASMDLSIWFLLEKIASMVICGLGFRFRAIILSLGLGFTDLNLCCIFVTILCIII